MNNLVVGSTSKKRKRHGTRANPAKNPKEPNQRSDEEALRADRPQASAEEKVKERTSSKLGHFQRSLLEMSEPVDAFGINFHQAADSARQPNSGWFCTILNSVKRHRRSD